VEKELVQAREHFIQGLSRISYFWGFPKAMGAIFGAIYLSPDSITLDELVEQVGISKGAASTNVRNLERLGMIHKQYKVGDRKDFYVAETDFWKIVKGILKEREKNEFDLALRSVAESLTIVNQLKKGKKENAMAVLYDERMQAMQKFFDTLDNVVAMFLALDDLRINSLKKLLGRSGAK